MRLLFEMDTRDYDKNGKAFIRPSVRSIIIRDGKIAMVHRVQKGEKEAMFIQDNYYYLCDTMPEVVSQKLDDYEAEEHFTLEFVDPREAICVNRENDHGPKDQLMLECEARVLELLMKEGLFEGEEKK